MQKRMLAMLLALAMLLGLAAVPATAAGLEVSIDQVALVEAEDYAANTGGINVIRDKHRRQLQRQSLCGRLFSKLQPNL